MSLWRRQDLNLLLYVTCILVVSCFRSNGNGSFASEFVFAIPEVYRQSNDQTQVIITTASSEPVKATLSIPGRLLGYDVTITRSKGADIELPADVRIGQGDGLTPNKTIIVRSKDNVSVYAIDNRCCGEDAFQVISSSSLGKTYIIASYLPDPSRSSFISISALNTNTTVTIQTPSGLKSVVKLKQYESYRHDSTEDLSGTVICSDEPITAISGSTSAIPSKGDGYSSIITQLIPVSLWGMNYHVFPFTALNSGFVYRVFAGNFLTTLLFSNGSSIRIQPNAFYQDDVDGNTVVSFESNHPVQVAQYMKGYYRNSPLRGASSMSIIAPVSSFTNNVTFPTFKLVYSSSNSFVFYINVITMCENILDLVLNDDISLSTWNDRLTADNQSMCCVRGKIWNDRTNPSYHSVTHPKPDATFFVSVYGMMIGQSSSYLHTALGNLPPVYGSSECVELLTKQNRTSISLEDLSLVVVSNESVVEVAEALVQLTDRPNGMFTDTEIDAVGEIVASIVAVQNGSMKVTQPVVESISNLMGAADTRAPPTAQFTNATSRIVQSLETQISLSLKENDDVRIVDTNIAVQGIKPKTNNTEGIGFAIMSEPTTSFNSNTTKLIDNDDFDDTHPLSSIYLSSRIVNNLKEKSTDKLIFIFLAYRNNFLFASERATRDNLTVDGIIIAASVEGVDSKELNNFAEPVVIENHGQQDSERNNTGARKTEIKLRDSCHYPEPQCVFWDFEINDWSPKGCIYVGSDNPTGNHQCECDHLTNFAVLVYHGQKHIVSKGLDYISKIGCGLSIATLMFTVTLFTFFNCRKRKRGVAVPPPNSTHGKLKKKARTITVHLSVSLIGLYLVFLIGVDWTCPEVNCTVTAALLHYFVLTSMAWMTVEARFLYIKLVRVFYPESEKFVSKSAILAWGIPLIVVAISMGVSFGVGSDDYQNKLYCFPKVGFVVYFAILLPIAVAIIYNMITFGIIMKSISRPRPGQKSRSSEKKILIDRCRSSVTITCLLGLTWIFGFFAIESATLVFQWLFCILNSLQGVFIFIFMCLTQDEVKSLLVSIGLAFERRFSAQSGLVSEERSNTGGAPNSSELKCHNVTPTNDDSAVAHSNTGIKLNEQR